MRWWSWDSTTNKEAYMPCHNYVVKARDYVCVCFRVHIMSLIVNRTLIMALRAIYGNNGYIIFQSSKEDCKSASRCFLNEQGEIFDKNKERKWNARYHKDSTILKQSQLFRKKFVMIYSAGHPQVDTLSCLCLLHKKNKRVIMSVAFVYLAILYI